MPVFSFANPNGDPEFALRKRQGQMSDYIAMAQLAAQERMSGMANDTQRYGMDKGSATQLGVANIGKDTTLGAARIGADSAGNVAGIGARAQTDTAGIQTAPQMLAENRRDRVYADEAPQRSLLNARAGLEEKRLAPQGRIAGLIDSEVERSLTGGGQPGGQSLLRPQDLRGMIRGYAGLGADPIDAMWHAHLAKQLEDDPENAPALIEAASSGNIAAIPKARGSLDQKRVAEYSSVKQMVDPDIKAVFAEIRKNNWRIGDADKSRITGMAEGIMNKMRQLRVSPETQAMIQEELKRNIENALHENGAVFEASGSETLRAQNGLPY